MDGQKAKRKQGGNIGNAKKRKRTSKNRKTLSNNSINRMEEAFLRFPHLPEQIFKKLDNESLTNSRVVGISWHNFIDNREYPWIRIKNIIDDLKQKCRDGETIFHLACREGHAKIAEVIMKKSAELNVDLNTKNIAGWTAFHMACYFGKKSIVELMISNSDSFNLDLTARNNNGKTGFQLAEDEGELYVIS